MFSFRPGTCDWNVYYNIVERNEYELPETFSPGDVILDIGAHIGSFSLACLRRGQVRVAAYEAVWENYSLAQAHLVQFADRVSLTHAAVWRSDTERTVLR